jgi:CTP:molybdopterin cytidylyltransferase MocA
MSPNVGNFVHDLVEMAKAMETLPQVEHDRDSFKAQLDQALATVQDREVSILSLKAEIETLNAKVRQTEAERDDAEIRFLECDDRMVKLERSFQAALEAMDATNTLIQSFKPQPMPEPIAQAPVNEVVQSIEPVDQSASSPIASTSDTHPDAEQAPATTTAVDTTGEVGYVANPPKGPYSGIKYYDHPTYVPYSQWIEGGGNDEDYHWCPNPTSVMRYY